MPIFDMWMKNFWGVLSDYKGKDRGFMWIEQIHYES